MYNKEEAQERINQLQAEGKPFVFIINFECTQAFVEATTDIDSNEMMCAFPRSGAFEMVRQAPTSGRLRAKHQPCEAQYHGRQQLFGQPYLQNTN